MTSKKQSLYEQVVDLVVETVEKEVGYKPKPDLVMSDFDMDRFKAFGLRKWGLRCFLCMPKHIARTTVSNRGIKP